MLRWSERVRGESEYKVTLKSGSFDPKSAGYFSRGLYLSVDLEVNGVAYGPSTIVKRNAELYDLVTDCLGVIIGVAIAPLFEPLLRSIERGLVRTPGPAGPAAVD